MSLSKSSSHSAKSPDSDDFTAYDNFGRHKQDWESVQEKKHKVFEQLSEKIESGEMQLYCTKTKLARGLNRMTILLDSLEDMAIDNRLSDADRRVLFLMIGQMDFENWIHIPLSSLSKKLNIAVPNISRSVKNLVELKYISKEKVGRANLYRFNPEMGWKGRDVDWSKVVDLDEIRSRQRSCGSTPHRVGPQR